jgi:hypothetical protein
MNMKVRYILIVIISIFYLNSCCSSLLDNETFTSKYPLVFKQIKYIMENPNVLDGKQTDFGCISESFFPEQFWINFIREHYKGNICSIETIYHYEHYYYHEYFKKNHHILVINIELEDNMWGITFEFLEENGNCHTSPLATHFRPVRAMWQGSAS